MGATNMDDFIKAYNLNNYVHTEHINNAKKTVGIDVYYCKCCKYYTDHLSHFKEHLSSKKHVSMSKDNYDNKVDNKQFKRKIHCCDKCDNIYTSNRSLTHHKKKMLLKIKLFYLNTNH